VSGRESTALPTSRLALTSYWAVPPRWVPLNEKVNFDAASWNESTAVDGNVNLNIRCVVVFGVTDTPDRAVAPVRVEIAVGEPDVPITFACVPPHVYVNAGVDPDSVHAWSHFAIQTFMPSVPSVSSAELGLAPIATFSWVMIPEVVAFATVRSSARCIVSPGAIPPADNVKRFVAPAAGTVISMCPAVVFEPCVTVAVAVKVAYALNDKTPNATNPTPAIIVHRPGRIIFEVLMSLTIPT
jgi:hypothetical protein